MPIVKADTLEFLIQGQTFVALPSRGLWWPEQSSLIVADTHFGKDEVFRKAGVPLPQGTDDESLARLSGLLDYTAAEHLWVLGDLLHGKISENAPFVKSFAHWRAQRPQLSVTVTSGNHDRHQQDKSCLTEIEWVDEIERDGIVLRHVEQDSDHTFMISGHAHPVYRLTDARKSNARLPIFWIRSQSMVLPAFSHFTGGKSVHPKKTDRLIGALEDAAIPLTGMLAGSPTKRRSS